MSSVGLTDAFPPAEEATALEALVRTLSDHASIGIFLTDPQGRTLYLNEQLRRMAGLADSQATGNHWLTLLSPEDHDPIRAEWSQAATEGRSFSREFHFNRADGSRCRVKAEAFPLRTETGASTGYVGMVREITPRQPALEALPASEERYRNLIQLSPHAILAHSAGTILFINEAGIRLFGITAAQDIAGRSLSEFFPKEFFEEQSSPVLPTALKPATPMERRYTRPDGTIIDVELVAAPVSFDGQPAVQVMVTDTTAQKETAARLHHAKKMEAVATLAGGIAHELNNCLTAILGFSDLALPSLVPDSRVHGHVQQVILASKRARDLVMQMLVFGRQAESTKQPISLDILLKETLRILRGRLPDNISVREWIHGATKPVFVDPTQIHHVCVSLLAHCEQAMKATGGILEVRLDNIRLGTGGSGQALPLAPGQYVRLTVSDTGESLGPDRQARLFDPFFTATSTEHGAGTGLAGVQSIVSEHGGTLHATSTVGQGTTIEVYLPAMLHPNSVIVTEPIQEGPAGPAGLKESLAELDKER